jgi:hypothetical protein
MVGSFRNREGRYYEIYQTQVDLILGQDLLKMLPSETQQQIKTKLYVWKALQKCYLPDREEYITKYIVPVAIIHRPVFCSRQSFGDCIQSPEGRGLAVSTGANWVGFYLTTGTKSHLGTL